ncbi:MAG: transpeptidase family protein [Saprospiraceae bacterium]|nr:transpeptidase family protein [Saprospiraceae bacterium]
MDRRTELTARAYFVVTVFAVLALIIAFRVLKISLIEGDKWRAKGSKNVQWMEVDADRGNIYADDESLLATSLQFFEIRMDATVPDAKLFKSKVDSLALMLSRSIRSDKTYGEWKKTLYQARKAKNRYLFIAKALDTEEVEMVRKFPIFRAGRYGGGFLELRYGTRKKPFNQLASRTIGEDRNNAQKVGLEGYFDKFLKGPTDKRLMKKIDNTQDIWVPVYDPSEFEIKRGDDIVTTINVHLQDVVHAELEKQLIKSQAASGTAILMEVKTGAIKAISNLTLKDSVGVEIINTAIANSSEPGSTFKLATVLALLEDSLADVETQVNLNAGTMHFSDRIMHDSEKHNKHMVSMKEAFAISSNVGIAKLANDAYNRNEAGRMMFRSKLTQFGLDQMTDIEIAGEGVPKIKDPVRNKKDWYGTTIPWMAHGYELAITPLQLLNFYNAVANDGRMMKPYLVSEIRKEDGVVKKFEPKAMIERIARPENITKAQEMLLEVVENGTAKNIQSSQVSMAGKTGTTRVNYSNREEFAKYNASFCGYFPADNPEYSMIVILYDPKGAFYGASVAAPVFKAVAEKAMAWRFEIAPVYNDSAAVVTSKTIPERNVGFGADFTALFDYVGLAYKKKNKNPWVSVDPFETKMIVDDKKIAKNAVPDVRGMGARDAMYVLENLGLRVSVIGRGKVIRQSLIPGTRTRGQHIDIFLD